MAPLRLGVVQTGWLGTAARGSPKRPPTHERAHRHTPWGSKSHAPPPYGFFGRKASDMGIDQLRAGGWKLI
jgi:hypothetical protein